MNLWGRLKLAYRAITLADFPQLKSILEPISVAGITVTHATALNYAAWWNAVDLISSQIAALPRILYRRLSDEERERATNHPVYRLLHDAPNPYMTPFTFWQTLGAHVLSWGNAYAEIEWDAANRPRALWPIPPDKVVPEVEGNRLRYIYNGARPIAPEDILHVPGLGFDGLKGYSVVSMARQTIGLGVAAERFGAGFFGNGAWPGLTLTHPGQLSGPAQQNLRKSITDRVGGPNALGLLILEEGMKVEKVGIPPNDAQFLQTREFQVVEVARWFNLPPRYLKHGDGEAPTTPEANWLEFAMLTLQPWLVRIEQECNRKLLGGAGSHYVEHLVDAKQRVDVATRMNTYKTLTELGVIDAAQIARWENLPPPPKPKAPPEPEPPPEAEPDADRGFSALLEAHFAEFVRAQAEAVRREAKKGRTALIAWSRQAGPRVEDALRQRFILPAVRAALIRSGSEADPERVERAANDLAVEVMARWKEDLLAVGADAEPLAQRWIRERPREIAEMVVANTTAREEDVHVA